MAQSVAGALLALLSFLGDCDTPLGPSDEALLSLLRADRAVPGPRFLLCPTESRRVAPGQVVQAVVDEAGEGAIICLETGVHRAQTIAPRNRQHFVGAPGAVMTGTVEVTDIRQIGAYFTFPAPFADVEIRGSCLSSRPLCTRPGLVFIDGKSVDEVGGLDDLGPNRFVYDRLAGRILMSEDPRGRNIEASAAAFAFLANGASDVVISDLTIQHYGNPAQRGAVYDDTDAVATGWRIEHNTVMENAGLGVLGGPGATIVANRIERNGQLGIAFSSDNVAVEDNLIAGNNRAGFDPAWEAGGLKGAAATGARIVGNLVYRNGGPGIWCDIECRDVLYADNLVAFNAGAGIFHEISYDATIRDNALRCNGMTQNWYWGAGILLASSRNVTVTGNVVVVPPEGAGIAIIDQDRTRGADSYYQAAGNRVEGNAVRFENDFGRMGVASDVEPRSPNYGKLEDGGNRFDANIYLVPQGFEGEFGWGAKDYVFGPLPVAGQERDGRMIVIQTN